jgi:hypothetical protein
MAAAGLNSVVDDDTIAARVDGVAVLKVLDRLISVYSSAKYQGAKNAFYSSRHVDDCGHHSSLAIVRCFECQSIADALWHRRRRSKLGNIDAPQGSALWLVRRFFGDGCIFEIISLGVTAARASSRRSG